MYVFVCTSSRVSCLCIKKYIYACIRLCYVCGCVVWVPCGKNVCIVVQRISRSVISFHFLSAFLRYAFHMIVCVNLLSCLRWTYFVYACIYVVRLSAVTLSDGPQGN